MARKVRHICTLLEIPYLNNATENNKRLVIRTVANGVKRGKKKRIKNAHQVSIFLTCLKCRCQRSGHRDETGHKLELQNIPAIKQVTFSFKDVFSPHCTMVIIGHLPALEVGSLPLLRTRPERMSEKAQFYGGDKGEVSTQGRRRGVRRRGRMQT